MTGSKAADAELARCLRVKLEKAEATGRGAALNHIEALTVLCIIRSWVNGVPAPTTKARRKTADTSKRGGKR